jgi:hypothetical protein
MGCRRSAACRELLRNRFLGLTPPGYCMTPLRGFRKDGQFRPESQFRLQLVGQQISVFPSLKEPLESRASRRSFCVRSTPKLLHASCWLFGLGRGIGCEGWLSRSCSTRLLRRSFRVRRHPYPSLRESACLPAVVQAHAGLTPSILVRPSRGRLAASINSTLGNEAESIGKIRLAFASARASPSEEEGPMQPRCYNLDTPVISLKGFPGTPAVLQCLCLAKRSRADHAAHGARGTQPDKE